MALDDAALGSGAPSRQRRSGGALRFLTYPFRFFFRLLKRSLGGVIRTLAFHPVASLLVVLLMAAVGFLGVEDYNGGRLHVGPGRAVVNDSSLPPNPATEDFIKGQTTFNAALMWQSFSDELKKQLSSRGTNEQSLQRQLDQRKQAGAKIDDVQYVGGVPQPDGSKVFVYVLSINTGPQGPPQPQHYVLTVDQSEKIIKVE